MRQSPNESEAVAAAKELRQLYDPQIQAAIGAVQQAAIDAACAGDRAGFEGREPPPAADIIAATREVTSWVADVA
jgi:hypothetical protein